MNRITGRSQQHYWRWALALSLATHLLIVMRVGTFWRENPLHDSSAAPSVTLDFSAVTGKNQVTPIPVMTPGHLGSGHVRSPEPVQEVRHEPVSSETSTVAESEFPVPDQPRSEPPAPEVRSGSVIWHSLGMAQHMTVNPWAGRRLTTLSAATTESDWLAYEEAFSNKVAEVGGVNYPPPQNGHPLSGSVRVATVLNADGSVAAVELLQTSGQPVLDQAALNIVHMAAPFLPFSESMRSRMDLVRIVRTFNFVRAGEPLSSR